MAKLMLVVVIALQIYYIIALVLGFFAYREFKQMLFDARGGAAMMGLPRMNERQRQEGGEKQPWYSMGNRNSTEMQSTEKKQNSNSRFQGQGVRIGSKR